MTEWCFFLNGEQRKIIEVNATNNKHDLISWLIFAVALPILTYFFAVVMNIIITPIDRLSDVWASVVNNGSLPIAAFGIISSGIPYLMEHLSNINSDINGLRKRVMAIATVFMFLTSGLFLFQSISPNTVKLEGYQNVIVFLLSIVFAIFSISVGIKMYLLQSALFNDYDELTKGNRDKLNSGLEKAYGDE